LKLFVFKALRAKPASARKANQQREEDEEEDGEAGDGEGGEELITPKRKFTRKGTKGYHHKRDPPSAENVPEKLGRTMTEDDFSILATGEVSANVRAVQLARRNVSFNTS
jgi:hypothetical protein